MSNGVTFHDRHEAAEYRQTKKEEGYSAQIIQVPDGYKVIVLEETPNAIDLWKYEFLTEREVIRELQEHMDREKWETSHKRELRRSQAYHQRELDDLKDRLERRGIDIRSI